MEFIILFVLAAFCLFGQVFYDRHRPKYPVIDKKGNVLWCSHFGSVSTKLEKGWPKHWYADDEES